MFNTKEEFKYEFSKRIIESYGRTVEEAHLTEKFMVLETMVRDYASVNWAMTKMAVQAKQQKQVHYFSMEFLVGRLLVNNMMNLGIYETAKEGLADYGINIHDLEELESDAGLGNGGLGRLAACFMDSLASLSYPAFGNTIRYDYGFFKQKIENGYQVEVPDQWLRLGNMWEVRKPKHATEVKFWGKVIWDDATGGWKHVDYEAVRAVPYDMPIVGNDTKVTNTLRLWKAEPSENIPTNKDFRQYAQVDRTTLLEVLITRRMFRQAMVIVEEFGYEGLDLSCLLKMTSRMILKSDMAEDDELLGLASEVYRKGKYDEVILHYLMLYRFGPLDELISIWKSARGFEMDTYDLEERILSLLIFTEDYRKEGEAVLESYVKQSGKERITGAYLTLVSYGVFVREYTMSTFIRSRLEYAFTSKWPVNLICRLALLQEISREKDPKPEYVGIAQSILEECAKENLKFAFFRKLSPELLSPYQLDDKTFVECRAVPGAKVTLFYRLDTGLGAETAYKCEPLKEMYQGIFVRTFTLFYGETLQYYFQIDEGDKDNTKKTSERSVSMKKVEGASGSKYQMLNQMLSARRLDKTQEVTDSLKDYLRQEQYVKNMFSIEKESGR